MERVTGIGGFFFSSPDPVALADWYERNLGIDPVPTSYGGTAWEQESGTTVFAPMPAVGDGGPAEFFWRPGQTFALNFRVDDLDAMVAQLRQAGIDVDVDPQHYPNGWFASLRDPDGNPIQLWQPEPES